MLKEYNLQDGSIKSYSQVVDKKGNTVFVNNHSTITNKWANSISTAFMSTFLPANYPHSVRKEYLEYQIWDSIQCISSSIRNVLGTKSILKAAGVGSLEATPLLATLIWISKDGIGMIGSLLFAYVYADSFELNVKEWRYVADCFNNIALLLDLLASVFSNHFYFAIVSASTLCKACCGLIAGAAKARISAHMAREGSLADVCAKESTQETLVGFCGLCLGMWIMNMSIIENSPTATWILFFVLLLLHQWANYILIRCLIFDTLNSQRVYLLTKEMINISNRSKTRNPHKDESIVLNDQLKCNNTATTNSINNKHQFSLVQEFKNLTPIVVARRENVFTPIWLTYHGPQLGIPVHNLYIPSSSSSSSLSEMLSQQSNQYHEYRKTLAATTTTTTDDDDDDDKANNEKINSSSLSLPFFLGVDKSHRFAACLMTTCTEKDMIQAYFLLCYLQQQYTPYSMNMINNKNSSQQKYSFIHDHYKECLAWYDMIVKPFTLFHQSAFLTSRNNHDYDDDETLSSQSMNNNSNNNNINSSTNKKSVSLASSGMVSTAAEEAAEGWVWDFRSNKSRLGAQPFRFHFSNNSNSDGHDGSGNDSNSSSSSSNSSCNNSDSSDSNSNKAKLSSSSSFTKKNKEV